MNREGGDARARKNSGALQYKAPTRRVTRGGRSVPALYGALTTGLVAVVMVVASVVSPATPPSITELSPAARERIEEARADQGIGPGVGGRCAPSNARCIESNGADRRVSPGSKAGVPPLLEVAAGRRCFGEPPRQTEDPHSPPCVFEIFRGDNGGATAAGVTGSEIRVAVPVPGSSSDDVYKAIAKGLIDHFNRRYEFYGRRLTPVFVEAEPWQDPADNRAAAEDLVAVKPFGVVSGFGLATNAVIHRRLAEARVVSIVSRIRSTSDGSGAPGFDSAAVVDGFTWLVDPPLDVRLRAGARFVCRALNGRDASHAGPEYTVTSRRFAVVVVKEDSGVRSNPDPLKEGLAGCNADFDVFDVSGSSDEEQRQLVLELKVGGYTTVLVVAARFPDGLWDWAEREGYFPEWVDFGAAYGHDESQRSWPGYSGQARHAFGLTPEVRVRPDAEVPAMWALRESAPQLNITQRWVEGRYNALLVLASGIQGAGPNLTPETFAQALRSTQFPNPSPGGPPYWQQGIGFGLGDPWFHDDYAIWWWNETAPPRTGETPGRGSFCYLDRGGRFTPDEFPADADERLFSGSEPCR